MQRLKLFSFTIKMCKNSSGLIGTQATSFKEATKLMHITYYPKTTCLYYISCFEHHLLFEIMQTQKSSRGTDRNHSNDSSLNPLLNLPILQHPKIQNLNKNLQHFWDCSSVSQRASFPTLPLTCSNSKHIPLQRPHLYFGAQMPSKLLF